MYCTKCGKSIDDSFGYCPYCGQKKFEERVPEVKSSSYEAPETEVLDETEKMLKSPYEYQPEAEPEKKPFVPPVEDPATPYDSIGVTPETKTETPEEAPAPAPVAGFDLSSSAMPSEEKSVKKIHSGLGWSIFLTILSSATCCMLAVVTSIIGIVFSGITKGKLRKGDTDGARSMRRVSRAMNWVSFVLILLWIALIVFTVVYSYANFTYDGSTFNYSFNGENISDIMREYGFSQEQIDEIMKHLDQSYSFDFYDPIPDNIGGYVLP